MKEFKFTAPKTSSELQAGVGISLNHDSSFVVNAANRFYVDENNWTSSFSIGQVDTSTLPAGYAFQWSYNYMNTHKNDSGPIFYITPKEFYGNEEFPVPPDYLGTCTGDINYTITAPGYETLSDSIHLEMSGDDTGIP